MKQAVAKSTLAESLGSFLIVSVEDRPFCRPGAEGDWGESAGHEVRNVFFFFFFWPSVQDITFH
jgi:hypothetical protein